MQNICIFTDFFDFACGIRHLLAFCRKGQTTFRTETKGNTVTFPNNVTQVILIIVILKVLTNHLNGGVRLGWAVKY
jgi:hypothetical protein